MRAEGAKNLPLLRAVAGPQQASFTDKALHDFTHSSYMLTPDCDRMACKLQGPQIETMDGSDIVSDGIVAGSVQVSANGQPIVMLLTTKPPAGMPKLQPSSALTFRPWHSCAPAKSWRSNM